MSQSQAPTTTTLEDWSRSDSYFASFLFPERDEVLEMTQRKSVEGGLPVDIAVSALQGKFLNLLVKSSNSKRVLEVGTLGGYSAIYLARALPEDGELVTLELEERHAKVAVENISHAGLEKKCTVIVGPAYDSMKKLSSDQPFDFVFIDADKQSNLKYFKEAKRLVKKNGIIIVDNVFRQGNTANPEYSEPKVEGVRELLRALKEDREVETSAIGTAGEKGLLSDLIAVDKIMEIRTVLFHRNRNVQLEPGKARAGASLFNFNHHHQIMSSVSTNTIRRRPPSHRRRLSTPARPRRHPRLSFCQPLPPSLEALDLSSASPTHTLASLRFLVLSYLAEVEARLSDIKGDPDTAVKHNELTAIEDVRVWSRTTLEMLNSIRADVCSHLPDLALPEITVEILRSHLPDLPSVTSRLPDFDFDFNDFDLRNKFDDVRTRIHDFDFHAPLEFVPTLSARLHTLQSHLSTFEVPQFGQASGGTLHSLNVMLSDLVDSLLSSELVTDILSSAPDSGLHLTDGLKESLKEGEELVERAALEVAHAVKRSLAGVRLITYADLPTEWKNNPFVTQGYRFIPIERWPLIIMSLFALHNETLNIHTHLVPFFLYLFNSIPIPNPFNIPSIPFVFNPISVAETDLPEIMFMSFALLCLFTSAILRWDWMVDIGIGFLSLCFATGLAGNIFPFMNWFNQYQYRGYRVLFFLSLAFSSLAPLAAIALTHSFWEMIYYMAPVTPSLLSYIIGLLFYVTHVPERWMSEKWRRRMDRFGGGMCIVRTFFSGLADLCLLGG
ncbi:inc metabolism membrane protein [Marasmius sp. AFHP31]|nr:inc metabolism membrane protein [Marasmius sp. AFHP31]